MHSLGGNRSIIGQPGFNTLTIRVPWAMDMGGNEMADVEVLPSTTFYRSSSASVAYHASVDRTPGKRGVVVSFELPPNDTHAYWYGELHLKWHRDTTKQMRTFGPVPPPHHGAAQFRDIEEHPLLRHLNPAQRKTFVEHLVTNPPPPAVHGGPATQGTLAVVPPPAPARPLTPYAPPPAKATTPQVLQNDAHHHAAMCAAYGGHVPGTPASYCQSGPLRLR
jgi:hypothetical protein